jgi:hypothetical protein
MEIHPGVFQERSFIPRVFPPTRSMSRSFSRVVLLAVLSNAGLAASAGLAAQQAGPGASFAQTGLARTGLAQAPAAAPAQDAAAQASAAPAQSPGAEAPAGQNQPVQGQPPQNQPTQNAPEDSGAKQTKRILGIVPNFRAVSADEKLPPETVKEKFKDATEDSFDYSSIFFPAVVAGYNMARDATPEFHQGGAGFARYFWHSAVDQTSENYMVEFIYPTITHEDARYYTLGHGGFMKRAGYALSRAVVTRTDSGKEVFNFSEVVGSGSAAGISNLYYPSRSRTVGNTVGQWGLDVGIDSGVFVFREFWPDINRHVFRNKYADTPSQQ